MATDDPAISVCFDVKIDGESLGTFNGCEGLGCEVIIEQREEGGHNGAVWQLPTRLKYSNIKLTRPVTEHTQKVAAWFSSVTTGLGQKTAYITAKTLDGTEVATWGLMDVVPVRWTGPALNPDSPKVATETVEFAHHGFLPPVGQPARKK
ncbi:MAG TPA: phage tail protein [Pseudonocardiaceae bacterium]|jgi:phage tail-like protein|nr:phage tail protein [Pseudonocardiaceae bacterium]